MHETAEATQGVKETEHGIVTESVSRRKISQDEKAGMIVVLGEPSALKAQFCEMLCSRLDGCVISIAEADAGVRNGLISEQVAYVQNQIHYANNWPRILTDFAQTRQELRALEFGDNPNILSGLLIPKAAGFVTIGKVDAGSSTSELGTRCTHLPMHVDWMASEQLEEWLKAAIRTLRLAGLPVPLSSPPNLDQCASRIQRRFRSHQLQPAAAMGMRLPSNQPPREEVAPDAATTLPPTLSDEAFTGTHQTSFGHHAWLQQAPSETVPQPHEQESKDELFTGRALAFISPVDQSRTHRELRALISSRAQRAMPQVQHRAAPCVPRAPPPPPRHAPHKAWGTPRTRAAAAALAGSSSRRGNEVPTWAYMRQVEALRHIIEKQRSASARIAPKHRLPPHYLAEARNSTNLEQPVTVPARHRPKALASARETAITQMSYMHIRTTRTPASARRATTPRRPPAAPQHKFGFDPTLEYGEHGRGY